MAKAGRKPTYNPERVEIILKSLEAGETVKVACQKGGISHDTFYEWKKQFPEFTEAVKNAENVFREWEMNGILSDAKRSLKQLICGYEYEETKTEYERDPANPMKPRIKRQSVTSKKVLPNVTAVIFALCNRDPENWKNRVAQELSGKVETDGASNVNLSSISDELLGKVMEELKGKE